MRAPIPDRPVRNRENRCPTQELHRRDPVSESPRAGPESALPRSHLLLTEEWFINAPAHARKHFFQFTAQSFTCGRMRFANQERKTVPLLASNRVAKLSDVSVKLRAIGRFAFVNEASRARRIV